MRIAGGDLRNGGFYRVFARNFQYAVYVAANRSYVGVREKFGIKTLDTELDQEYGPPHGTVSPKEFIKDCPLSAADETFNAELQRWIEENTPCDGSSKS